MEDPKPQDAAPHPKKQHQIRLRRLSTSRSYSQSSASAGCSGVDARNSSSAVINQRATTPAWLPSAASNATANGRKSLMFSLTIARPSA